MSYVTAMPERHRRKIGPTRSLRPNAMMREDHLSLVRRHVKGNGEDSQMRDHLETKTKLPVETIHLAAAAGFEEIVPGRRRCKRRRSATCIPRRYIMLLPPPPQRVEQDRSGPIIPKIECCINVKQQSQLQPQLQQQFHRRRRLSWTFFVALVIICSGLLRINVVDAALYDTCYDNLGLADADANGVISSTEFTAAIGTLSGGTVLAVEPSVFALGQSADGVVTLATVRADPTHAFCQALFKGILTTAATIDTSDAKCRLALTIGDSNRDNVLDQAAEYPRYANQLSGNQYGFAIAFASMPTSVQAVFDDFGTTTTGINILGSKASETPTLEQAALFTALCLSTGVAILAGPAVPATASSVPAVASVGATLVPTAVVPAPAPAPVPTAAAVPTTTSFTYDICIRMMVFSDASRNDALDQAEYYAWINRLTNNAWQDSASYSGLPATLQTNFATLTAGATELSILGSKPGATATPADTERLTLICTSTDTALQAATITSGAGPPVVPAAAPTPMGTTAAPISAVAVTPDDTALPYETCTKDMILADLSRDSQLDASEFVRLVSRVDATVVPTSDFSMLPQAYQDVFTSLTSGASSIDVTGIKPNETPSAEQEAHLRAFCSQLGAALTQGGEGGPVVTNPTPVLATMTSGNVTVVNSFVISNTLQLYATAFQQGLDRDSLGTAYSLFIAKVMTNYTTFENPPPTTTRQRHLRTYGNNAHWRHLSVTGIVQGSTIITQIQDSLCPGSVVGGGTLCQTVSAAFGVSFVQRDATEVLAELTQYTQERIIPMLSGEFVAIAPDTTIRIEGPTRSEAAAATPEGTSLPPLDPGSTSDPPIGMILGGTVIAVFVLGGLCYGYSSRLQKNETKTLDEKGEGEMSTNDDVEATSTFGNGVESAPTLSSPKQAERHEDSSAVESEIQDNSTNDDDPHKENFIKELASTAHDQQEKVQAFMAKKLRIGKKKNSNFDDDVGILETGDDFQEADDFGNYDFDEPYEMAQHLTDTTGREAFDSNWNGEWGGGAWDQPAGRSDEKTRPEKNTTSTVGDDDTAEPDCSDHSDTESSGSKSEFGKISVVSGASGNVGQLEGCVDNGDWDGVMQTAAQIENNLHDSITSAPLDDLSGEGSQSDSESNDGDNNDSAMLGSIGSEPLDDKTIQTVADMTPDERRLREMYREQVEELVRKAAPDEIGKISSMMDQFAGREAELINTLQTMYARSLSHRRLKSVHKSKAIPERDTRGIATGGTEGSAVIAAASMLTPETDNFEDDDDGGSQFDDEGSFDDDDRSQSHSRSQSQGSYESGSHSHDEDGRSKYGYEERSASGGQTESYGDDDDEGSFSGSHSGRDDDKSQVGSFTGSQSGSYGNEQDEGSYTGSRTGSYIDDPKGDGSVTGSRSGTYEDDENEGGSFTGSRSGSVADDNPDEGSVSGSRSGSYDGDEQDEGSFTGSRSGSFDDEANDNGSFTGSHHGSYDSEKDGGRPRGVDDDQNDDNGSYTGSHSGSLGHDEEGDSKGSPARSYGDDNSKDDQSRTGSYDDEGDFDKDHGSFTGSHSEDQSHSSSDRSNQD